MKRAAIRTNGFPFGPHDFPVLSQYEFGAVAEMILSALLRKGEKVTPKNFLHYAYRLEEAAAQAQGTVPGGGGRRAAGMVAS